MRRMFTRSDTNSALVCERVNMSSNALLCLYCKNKAVSGPKCIVCERVFHPKCVDRLNLIVLNSDQVICCKMPGTSNSTDNIAKEAVITFLKSSEFGEIIKEIVHHEVNAILTEVGRIRGELEAVKAANVDLIKLLTNPKISGTKMPDTTHVKERVSREQNSANFANNFSNLFDPNSGTKPPNKSMATNKKDDKPADLNKKLNEKSLSLSTDDIVNDNDNNDFIYPRYHQKRNFQTKNKNIINGTKSAKSSSLRAVEKMHHYYIGRIDPAMTENQVGECLKAELNLQNFSCEKLPSKGGNFNSFKLSVPQSKAADILNPQMWPEGIVVRRFFPSGAKHNSSSTEQNFRNARVELTTT